MNNEDIQQFMTAFEDFMKHAEENIDSHNRWEEARHYVVDGNHLMNSLEKKAAELEVTVDYYMAEFL
jgi:hypothetical protein